MVLSLRVSDVTAFLLYTYNCFWKSQKTSTAKAAKQSEKKQGREQMQSVDEQVRRVMSMA